MNALRSHELLHRRSSRLIVVDVQEKLVPTLSEETRNHLIGTCRFLCDGAKLLGVPVTITEQYPQGLGATVPELAGFVEYAVPKKQFSAVEATGWPTASEAFDERFQIVVAGLETHICVLQTVLDLLALGYQTFIVVDAVAGRKKIDHDIALERMANAGASLITAESALFEWCETAEAPEFKQLSALVKAHEA